MAGGTRKGRSSADARRRELAERLRERSAELEEAIFDRIRALEEADSGPQQLQGLRGVIGPTIAHGLLAVEVGERRSPEPPPAVIAHARKAAWRSIPTHTLHERYTAGYSIFKSFLLREVDSTELAHEIQTSTDVVFERLIQAAGEEHKRELQKRNRSSDVRRCERVEELLSGQIDEAPELEYPFDRIHLGVVGSGRELEPALRRQASSTGASLLIVRPAPNEVWAWIGSKREVSAPGLAEALEQESFSSTCVSTGEAFHGLKGWRLTHRQAITARSVATRSGRPLVRYSTVALLASVLEDEVLMASLTRRYLEPLSFGRDGGKVLRDTLRAYFISQRHASSTGKLLGVKRHTVASRLRTVEQKLDRNLNDCAPELELALQLETLW